MATSGIFVRSFNLRSRDRLRKPPQAKVTPKKSNSANPKTPEKYSDLRSHDIVAKAGSSQRQLRPRKVVEKNTSEGTHKKSSKTLGQQLQRRPKERKSTIKLKKTDETKKKLPVYKNISTEKSLEDQDSIYDFTFDPNDTLEKIAKKKQKKRNVTKRNVKTTKNIKKSKKKPNIPEEETASNMVIAEQRARLNTNKEKKKTQIIKKDTKEPKTSSHAIEDKTSSVIEQKEKDVKENDKKDSKEQIDTAEKKTLHVPSLAEQKKDVKESNKKDPKEQMDIYIAEKKTSHVLSLAEQIEDVKESNKENSKEQVDIHTAEKKTSHVPLLVEQKEDLNLVAVKRENKIDRKIPLVIRTSEENFSPDATLTEQNETVNKSTPRIISIENADNITVNRVSNTSVGNFRSPLRPRNVFDNTTVKQQRKDNSSFNRLLTESLSPISSTADVVNIDSPWRPPIFPMFSQAKYFTQSTPKVNSKISKKPLETQEKENNQAIKKKVKKNKPAVDSKTLVKQENEENKLFVDDKEDRQIMDCEAVGENEHYVKDKEENEIPAKQENQHLMEYLNFSDTFDVLSDTEKRSTFGTEIRLFEDIEPTHFSEPPKRLYKRKRVKFNCLEEDEEKEDKENDIEEQQQTKKKRKHTKAETKNEKRINEWVEAVNNTFKEIDSYDLLIE